MDTLNTVAEFLDAETHALDLHDELVRDES
jgi:hypothetical protein